MNQFSVLMSVYENEEPLFLSQSIDSVLAQSVLPSEIIIVKDGLLNLELEIVLNEFTERNPHLFKIIGYKVNKGLGYALNFGLRHCKYEIIARMDADDICIPSRFQIQLDFLNSNPNIALVGSSVLEFNDIPGDTSRIRKVPLDNRNINKNKFYRNPFNHMTVMFRKECITTAGSYIDMPGFEDYYLWLRVLDIFECHNIEEPLVHARTGNGLISRRTGYSYAVREIKFQKHLRNIKMIGTFVFLRNIFLRFIPRLFPPFLMKIIYSKFLRHKISS